MTEQLMLMTSDEEFLYNSYNQLTTLQNNFNSVFGFIPLMVEIFTIFFLVLNLFLAVTFRTFAYICQSIIAVVHISHLLFPPCPSLLLLLRGHPVMERDALSGDQEKWRECFLEISKIRQTDPGQHRVFLLRRQTLHPHTCSHHRGPNRQPRLLVQLSYLLTSRT